MLEEQGPAVFRLLKFKERDLGMLPKALSIGKSIGLEAGSRLRRTAAVIQQKFNGKKI